MLSLGKILKLCHVLLPVVFNQYFAHLSNAGDPVRYITYTKEEEAIRCIQSAHGFILEGRPLR